MADEETPKDVIHVTLEQLEAVADKFDNSGPGVQEIDDFIVVDPNTPDGKAKADELDAAPDGTVTVDFGHAGKLTGCLVMNQAPGATFYPGQHVSVSVPVGDGYASITVDGAYIK